MDVKGKLPTGGSFVTDNSCKSIVYTTNDKYCAVKSAGTDEVAVGKIVDGQCTIVMENDSYCNKDANPGVLEGSGTKENPYLINSIEDLVVIKGLVDNDYVNYHFANQYLRIYIIMVMLLHLLGLQVV